MIDLYNILKESPNLNITISGTQLIDAIDSAVKKIIQELTPKKEETYLTTNKVAKILEVDRSTLWRWNKTGYLTHIEIGGKRRYRQSDIDKIMKGGVA